MRANSGAGGGGAPGAAAPSGSGSIIAPHPGTWLSYHAFGSAGAATCTGGARDKDTSHRPHTQEGT